MVVHSFEADKIQNPQKGVISPFCGFLYSKYLYLGIFSLLAFSIFYDIICARLNWRPTCVETSVSYLKNSYQKEKVMNTILIYTVLVLGGLITLFSAILATNWLWKKYGEGAFFCFLPRNHTACVVIKGQLKCYLMHKEDAQDTLEALEKMRNEGIIDDAGYNKIADKIEYRDGGLFGTLVKLFNLHLTSLNPFTTIMEVEVIKSKTQGGSLTSKELEQHISVGEAKPEKFLRLSWPRLKYIPDIELDNQAGVSIIVQCARVRVWNLFQIYFEYRGKISAEVDGAIASMFVNYLGTMTLSAFQKADMTAKTGPGSLFEAMQGKGLEWAGVYLEGPLAVIDWELSKDQQIIRDATQKRAAAEIAKQTKTIEAEATRDAEKLLGEGEAARIKATGEAHAFAAEKLTSAFGGNAMAAAKVTVARELSKPESKIRVIGSGSIVNIGEE